MTRMIRSDGYEPRFDINVQEGDEGERLVIDVLGLPAEGIEVKRKSRLDASFYVEYEHDPGRQDTYKPSGIATTEAEYWAYVINDTGVIVLIPTWRLRECFRLERGRWVAERDGDNPTHGLLVSFKDVCEV